MQTAESLFLIVGSLTAMCVVFFVGDVLMSISFPSKKRHPVQFKTVIRTVIK